MRDVLRRHGLLICGILLVTAVAAALAWRRTHAPPPQAFAPNRANDKVLIAGGWNAHELEKILADFKVTYRSELRPDFTYDVQSDGALHKATFPSDIQPWLFVYLLNYAQYPKGFHIEGRTILVAAQATLTPDFELPAQNLYGRKATFYVPAHDDKYNLVYVHAGEDTYEISFDADAWKKVTDARVPADLASLLGR